MADPSVPATPAEDDPYVKRDGKVIRGKNGWLFLANDRNKVLDQHSGEFRFTRSQLRRWEMTLELRDAYVRRLGGGYVFLVPPNAHSVYPEHLPDSVPSAPTRPVHQLIEWLASTGSFARVTYPLDAIVARRDELPPYTPTDSHWSAFAAFLAYEAAMDELGPDVPQRRVGFDEIEFTRRETVGDLGNKVEPPVSAEQVTAVVREPAGRLVSDNRVRNNGRIIEFACDAAPEGCCVLHGDSFTYAMLRFAAESFRRLVFLHTATLDYDVLRRERPIAVISCMNERFLRVVPPDGALVSVRKQAAKRLATGDVLTERVVAGLSSKLLWP